MTAIVWLGVSMAEPTDYRLHVKVEIQGYDTVRYAVVSADTALTLRVRANGYTALIYNLLEREPVVKLQVEGDSLRRTADVDRLQDALREQFPGIRLIDAGTDSVRVTLAPREHRTYRPVLDKVSFAFAEQYGLYGQPVLTPSTVDLYGPQEALDRIDELCVAQASITGIKSSGRYTLALEPVWEQFADVHSSCTEVNVYLPVENYVDHCYTVPITVLNADTTVQLHLYPERVELHAWVARRDLNREPRITVSVDYQDILSDGQHLVPRLTEFPNYIRPRSIEPAEVQSVIIK